MKTVTHPAKLCQLEVDNKGYKQTLTKNFNHLNCFFTNFVLTENKAKTF